MARGWESKGVEEQQAEAKASVSSRPAKVWTALEIIQLRNLEGLRLSRSRIKQQLEAAQNPAHRQALEAALTDLDAQIASQTGPKV